MGRATSRDASERAPRFRNTTTPLEGEARPVRSRSNPKGPIAKSGWPGRGRGSRSTQRPPNRLHHALGIRQDLVVPTSDHAIAAALEPGGVRRTLLRVLAAVDFDDESCLGTKEVDDVAAYRLLAAEAETIELLAPQLRPQPNLGVGRIDAQLGGEGRRHGGMWRVAPLRTTLHVATLPLKGEGENPSPFEGEGGRRARPRNVPIAFHHRSREESTREA
jgi:hypothetical protein